MIVRGMGYVLPGREVVVEGSEVPSLFSDMHVWIYGYINAYVCACIYRYIYMDVHVYTEIYMGGYNFIYICGGGKQSYRP
jgi:hypothetical protein